MQHKAQHETDEGHSFLYIKSDVLSGSKAKRNRYLHKFASEETEEQRGIARERMKANMNEDREQIEVQRSFADEVQGSFCC